MRTLILLLGFVVSVNMVRAQVQQMTIKWDKTLGGTNDESVRRGIKTSDGGYILAGSSQSPVSGDKSQASRGGWDFWAVKINQDGAKVWDKTFGGTGEERLLSIAATADGGYLLGGLSNSNIGVEKW